MTAQPITPFNRMMQAEAIHAQRIYWITTASIYIRLLTWDSRKGGTLTAGV